jgi:hypothetical protein
MTLGAGALLRPFDWSHTGGFVLLAAVLFLLLASVNRSARGR